MKRTLPCTRQKGHAKQNDHGADEHNERRLRSYEPLNEESCSEGRSRSVTQLSGNSQTSPEPDKRGSPPKSRSGDGNGVPRQDLQTILTTDGTEKEVDPRVLLWWSMKVDKLIKLASSPRYRGLPDCPELNENAQRPIIEWLCKCDSITAGLTPDPPEPPPIISTIDTTPNAAQKKRIATEEKKYLKWSHEQLVSLARQRSYTISTGTRDALPHTTGYLAHWLASWDVLLSDREKKWWVGDGKELEVKAFSAGYRGMSKKYTIIAWLVERGKDLDVTPKELKLTRSRRHHKQKTGKRKTDEPEERVYRGRMKRSRGS
ncbi:hypothetical protein ACEPPN_012573 [Leptodophora sp. 'Broadleaf-Isolate-01']